MKFANSVDRTCMSFFLLLADVVGNPQKPFGNPLIWQRKPLLSSDAWTCHAVLARALPAPCRLPATRLMRRQTLVFKMQEKCFQLSFLYCPIQYEKKCLETEFVVTTAAGFRAHRS